jgi:hypothetical protein
LIIQLGVCRETTQNCISLGIESIDTVRANQTGDGYRKTNYCM